MSGYMNKRSYTYREEREVGRNVVPSGQVAANSLGRTTYVQWCATCTDIWLDVQSFGTCPVCSNMRQVVAVYEPETKP